MSRLPIPHIMIDTIYDIGPDKLKDKKIELLLIDLDNTMSPYSISEPSPGLIRWADDIKKAGIDLFIISNSRSERPRIFAEALGIGYINRARKPFTGATRRVLEHKGASPEKTAIIGDQIYTDVLCARLLGMTAIAVRPISLKNPLLAVRYLLESPFRLAYKVRNSNE